MDEYDCLSCEVISFLLLLIDFMMEMLKFYNKFHSKWCFFNMQHKFDKARAFKGKQGTTGGIDLMIVDIPKGLPVSMVSSLPTSILEWNFDDKNFLAIVFDIGSPLVHDNRVLLFFYKDNLKLKANIRGSVEA